MRRVPYEEYMEYINTVREKDTFYHVSRVKSILSILKHGFDQSLIGTEGGCQGGGGFSCTWSKRDALEWGQKIYGYHDPLAVAKITLPNARIATHEHSDSLTDEARIWGLENGYLVHGVRGDEPTGKLAFNREDLLADYGWTLMGLYLRTLGYDGYFVGMDEVVIMNFRLLVASAFELV